MQLPFVKQQLQKQSFVFIASFKINKNNQSVA